MNGRFFSRLLSTFLFLSIEAGGSAPVDDTDHAGKILRSVCIRYRSS